MLWTDDFLFLHFPKTAGKSLTRALVETLGRPMTCLVSKGQVRELADCDHAGLTIIEGWAHENMRAASKRLAEYGKSVDSFKAIILGIRNPYDLMVSNYFFMRKTYKHNREKDNFKIAMENNFEDYTLKVGFAPIENWMTINGSRPENLRLIRFEHLQKDFDALANEFGFQSIELPHINPSSHDHYSAYLTPTAEEAIYQKMKYLFDQGFYNRQAITRSKQSDKTPGQEKSSSTGQEKFPSAAVCNICNGTRFIAGPGQRLGASGMPPKCGACKSLERHRALRSVYQALEPHLPFTEMSALQFSNDRSVESNWFESYEISVYKVANSIDIEAVDRKDGQYDAVICNHVLEHVKEDDTALGELMRITSERGFLQISVPGSCRMEKTRDWGFPDPSKHGHYRQYGMDFELKYRSVFGDDIRKIAVGAPDPVTGAPCLFFFFTRNAAAADVIIRQLGTASPHLQDAPGWGVESWGGAGGVGRK
jgi:hypothetical protein